MTKLKLIICLFLSQIFFASSACACIHNPPNWEQWAMEKILTLLVVCLILMIPCALISAWRNRKNISKSELLRAYLRPVLFYFIALAAVIAVLVLGTLHNNSLIIGLCYVSYALYIIYCCGYQFHAYLKHRELKRWTWVAPLWPLFIYLFDLAAWHICGELPFKLLFIVGIDIVAAYVLYRIYLQKTPKFAAIKKYFWLALLLICSGFSIYILLWKYDNSVFEDQCAFCDCM